MQRKKYADYIKGIGIILVVLGHINSCNGFLKDWIYAFHMPLLFFVSGITVKKAESVSWKAAAAFVWKRAKSLLVPYMLWGLIYAGYSPQNVLALLYGSYSRISNAGSLSSLWFLPTMFLAVCGMEAAKALDCRFKTGKPGYLLILLASLFASFGLTKLQPEYPFCLNVAFLALAFMIAGFLWETLFMTSIRKRQTLLWSVLGIITFLGTLTHRLNPIAQTSYVLMASMRVGNPCAFLFTASMGCLAVYFVSVLLDSCVKETKILSFLGRNSLVIFAVHKPVIEICSKLLRSLSLPNGIRLLVIGTAVLAVSSVISLCVNYAAPSLAGKS